MKHKSQRYKGRVKDLLVELDLLTNSSHWLNNELIDKTHSYDTLLSRYEQDSALFRLEN